MDLTDVVFDDAIRAVAFVGLYFAVFMLAKWFKSFFLPYKLDHELTQSDNIAVALAMSGYYFATTIIFLGALFGPDQGLGVDVMMVGGYTLLGLILLNLARWFNEKAILNEFSNMEQLIKEKNAGLGAVHFSVYVATGLIAAGAISGQGGGVITSIVFFVIGQVSLFLFSHLYEKLSPYNIYEELKNGNVASGIAFGGHLIALAILVMNAASGDFIDWKKDIILYVLTVVIAFVFLPILRFVMDRMVVPGESLAKEIREDRNIGAGLLDATCAISFAIIIAKLI